MKKDIHDVSTMCTGRWQKKPLALLMASGVCAFSVAMSSPALAQGALEEIFVTARKVEENTQTTPIALTALSEATLERKQITNVEAIQYTTPNVTITPLVGNSGVGITIRGQAGSENTSASDAAVGVYVDGVYVARSTGGLLDLVDVERVEVLRGPQGTLFGRNTTGGALNIVTPDPIPEFTGHLKAKVGNYDKRSVEGVVNLPLVEEALAARISFKHDKHDGYGKSLATGRELANLESNFIRGVIKLEPDDSPWYVTVNGDYYTRKGNGPIAALHAVNPRSAAAIDMSLLNVAGFNFPAGPLTDYFADDFYENYSGSKGYEDIEVWGTSIRAGLDFDWGSLLSITAYRTTTNNVYTDTDGTPLNVIEFEQNNEQVHQITQEFQLSGYTDNIDWITGIFFFTEENEDLTESSTANTYGEVENESQAIFGQATYSFTPALRVTGGLRYTEDERELALMITDPSGAVCRVTSVDVPGTCMNTRSAKYDYWSYTLSADYAFSEDLFGYIKTSKANRAGGFNTRQVAPPFEPEEVTDYEVGLKANFFENRLRTNLAVFYTQYDEVQRTILSLAAGAPSPLTQNAAKATIPGIELEVSALPHPNLEVGFSLGIIDPEYDEYTDELGNDLSSYPFLQTSEETYNVYATYTQPLQMGDLVLHADYGYQSERYYNYTPQTAAFNRQEGYGLLNARITMDLVDTGVKLGLWGRNLTDEEYNTYILDTYTTPFGYNSGYRGEPRTFGAEVTYAF